MPAKIATVISARGRCPCARRGGNVEWIGTSTDVDDLVQLQQQQEVLVGELQHRTRNLMAMVQAITRAPSRSVIARLEDFANPSTIACGRSPGSKGCCPAGRPACGCRSTRCCAKNCRRTSPLDAEARAAGTLDAGRRAWSCARRWSRPLRSHCTNSQRTLLKYGALSVPGGHFGVRWGSGATGRRRRLLVDWREPGVSLACPIPAPPGAAAMAANDRTGASLSARRPHDLLVRERRGALHDRAGHPLGRYCHGETMAEPR